MASVPMPRQQAVIASRAREASRTFAWFGIGAFVLGMLVTWCVQFTLGEAEYTAGGQALYDALDNGTTQAIWRISSGAGFIVAAMLIVFATGLKRILEARDPESDIPGVIYGSILLSAAMLAVAMVLRAQVFDGFTAYEASPESHVTINRLQQDGVLAGWAILLAGAAATAWGGLRTGMFPKWLGIVSLIMTALATLLMLGGVAFPSHIPLMIWLACIATWALRQPTEV